MADSAIPGNESIADRVEELRSAGISVDFTDYPVTFERVREDGYTIASVGLVTKTRTGRVFVELFDSSDNIRLTMLEHLEDDLQFMAEEGLDKGLLTAALLPKTVLELREWAELRDELMVGAA